MRDPENYRQCPSCGYLSTAVEVRQIKAGPVCPRCGEYEIRHFDPLPPREEQAEGYHGA